jgi:cytochrome P450
MFTFQEIWFTFFGYIGLMNYTTIGLIVMASVFCFVGGPRIIKDTVAFSCHSINFVNAMFKKYGTEDLAPIPFRVFPMVTQPSLFISNPSHVMQMLNNRHNDFSEKSHPAFLKVFTAALPYTTVTEETKELWRRNRARVFHHLKPTGMTSGDSNYLQDTIGVMREVLRERTLPEWKLAAEKGDKIDIGASIFTFASIVAFRWVTKLPSKDIPDYIHPIVNRTFELLSKRVLDPLANMYPNIEDSIKKEMDSGKKAIRDWLNEVYPKCPDESYFKYVMDDKSLKDGETARTLVEKYGEILGSLVGASETIIRSMQLSILHFAEHPEIQEEIYQHLCNDGVDFKEDIGHVSFHPITVPYVEWMTKEILRLFHPAYLFTREVVKDTAFEDGNYPLKKGTVIWGSQCVLHKIPGIRNKETGEYTEIWGNDAEVFRPTRWENRTRIMNDSFNTFIKGARQCPGIDFSHAEVATVITTIIKNFRIRRADNIPISVRCYLTQQPDREIYIYLEKRI